MNEVELLNAQPNVIYYALRHFGALAFTHKNACRLNLDFWLHSERQGTCQHLNHEYHTSCLRHVEIYVIC